MGIRRRIEITAYRRATMAFRDQPGGLSTNCSPAESKRTEPIGTDLAPVKEDVARSSELTLLIEALVKNDGDSDRAAQHLGLSRSDFISKLCGFGSSIK